MKVPLIEVYPLVQDPPDPRTLLVRNHAIQSGYPVAPLPEPLTITTPTQHVAAALQNFSTNILPNLIKRRLDNSPAFRQARALMPPLNVAEISRYRKLYPSFCSAKVAQEIEIHGLPLSQGQVLFHGGPIPRSGSNSHPHAVFRIEEPLSTTLCAQVAAVHSLSHQPNEIWIITAPIDTNTKAFVFSNTSGQTHGHETEILLAPGAVFHLLGSFQIGEHSVFNLSLY